MKEARAAALLRLRADELIDIAIGQIAVPDQNLLRGMAWHLLATVGTHEQLQRAIDLDQAARPTPTAEREP